MLVPFFKKLPCFIIDVLLILFDTCLLLGECLHALVLMLAAFLHMLICYFKKLVAFLLILPRLVKELRLLPNVSARYVHQKSIVKF
jgi:hypothetical protein